MNSLHLVPQKCVLTVAAFCCIVSTMAQSPHWRGPNQSGQFPAGNYPSALNETSLNWKTPLPGKGTSTPILVNDKIFLTCPSKGQDSVMAFNPDGSLLWETKLGVESPGKHRNGSGSNASPATDGKRIFVYFKSGTLAGLNLKGEVLWKHNLVEQYGPDTLYWDHGTSPVVTQKGVVMTRMHEGESWLASYHPESGKLQWKTKRNYSTPREGDHGYTTPIVTEMNGKEVILVWGAQHLTAHDPADGSNLWTCGNFNPNNVGLWPAVATPVLVKDVVIVPFGRADKRQPRLHGIRFAGKGDVTETHRLWKTTDHSCFVPSPTTNGDLAFVLSDRGTLAAIDPETGKQAWNVQLPEHRANYYASPTVAGSLLFATREDGNLFVVDIEQRGKLLSEQDMGERIIASPVAVHDQILIRGEKHLMSFSNKSSKS